MGVLAAAREVVPVVRSWWGYGGITEGVERVAGLGDIAFGEYERCLRLRVSVGNQMMNQANGAQSGRANLLGRPDGYTRLGDCQAYACGDAAA